MIDEFISAISEMLKLLFHGIWSLTKILVKAFFKFLKNHPRYAFLLPILLLAAYNRFSYISSSTLFLGTDKQDITIVTQLFSGTLAMVGRLLFPGAFSLGPFYNYFIAPPLLATNFDPIGPAFLAGLVHVATVYLVYLVGKKLFNLQAGLFSAGLYASSSFAISYVNQSWNLDILPFFSVLLLLTIYNAAASARPFFSYLAAGLLLGICLQLHYVSLFLGILVFIYMLVTEVVVKGKSFFLPLLKHYLELLIGFLISLNLFLFYEYLHKFSNTKAFSVYLFDIAGKTSIVDFFSTIPNSFFNLFARLTINFPSADSVVYYPPFEVTLLGSFAIILAVFSSIMLIFLRNKFIILLFLLWLGLGIISLSFFKNDIYDYHFTLLYPVIALLVGNLLAFIFHLREQERVKMEKQLLSSTEEGETYTMIPVDATDTGKLILHRVCIGVSVLLFFIIFLLSLSVLPVRFQSNERKAHAAEISAFVIEKANKNPFNFALIANPNAPDKLYREEMKKLKSQPVGIQHPEIDPEKKTITDQLLVVCEDPNCKPLESSLWNIRGFGRAAILTEWSVAKVKVYLLVHPIER